MALASPYLSFVARNLEARLLGTRRPFLAGFKVTHRCNLRCRACPFWRRPADDIPYRAALRAMDALHRAGARLLILEGGEPFLWRDGNRNLEDLVRAAKARFYRVGVATNGTLPLETEADVLWVSLDGLEESHDYNRGPTFRRIVANLERSSHPRKLAQLTINRRNRQEIPDLVRFLAGKVQGITFQFHYPYPESEDLYLPLEERGAVLDDLIRLKREGFPILDSYATLEALKGNTWHCHDWLIANVEPTGQIHLGCYLKGRGPADCRKCGFAAHVELSLAFDWHPGAIATGLRTFGLRPLQKMKSTNDTDGEE
ncbi:MAG: radical SAM protein [Anaerolineae bacterium]